MSALDFEGSMSTPVEVDTETSSGLDAIYVVEDTHGVSMVYTASSPTASVRWSRYSRLGASYAEEVTPTRDGATLSLDCSTDDMGYVIEENGRSKYYWIVNYANHFLDLESLSIPGDQDCGSTHLTLTGNASGIDAYSPLGRRITVSRQLEVRYTTMIFDEDDFRYKPEETSVTLDAIDASFSVTAPLTDTSFTLIGDRFLKVWKKEQEIESSSYTAISVEASTRATQAERNNDNEQKVESSGLGGSAPVDITFEAAITDAAIFTEWQISRTPDFSDVYNSFSELEFSYSFTEQGTSYVRFTADNASGTCPFESETYQIFIGESKLDIPNAFSPGTSPGVNDEWKVSYKSLVSYKCTIFNRWGKKLFESDNPAQGWDGMSGGKVVPSGVYFYVIKAVGADGIKYDRAGDINIIGYKDNRTSNSEQVTE